jgi:hypothetical protein
MFPPVTGANIIAFSAIKDMRRARDADRCVPSSLEEAEPFVRRRRPLPPPKTESCKNQRLRIARRDAWREAGGLTNYWRARLDWQCALEIAQTKGIADSGKFPSAREDNRWGLVDAWRAALVKQMLTPAPDAGSVAWKRAKLLAGDFVYTDVKPERLQRAIDDDVAWLAAHPTRKSIAATKQKSS